MSNHGFISGGLLDIASGTNRRTSSSENPIRKQQSLVLNDDKQSAADYYKNLISTTKKKNEDSDVEIIDDPDVVVVDPCYFCKECKISIKLPQKGDHELSSLHLLDTKRKPKLSAFFLPESNKGFQLLRKMGWDSEKGLGVNGQGRVAPVATARRPPGEGLGGGGGGGGGERRRRRVTHFPAHSAAQARADPEGKSAAVRAHEAAAADEIRRYQGQRKSKRKSCGGSASSSRCGETRFQKSARLRKEKALGEEVRLDLYRDVPEGYESLFVS